MKRALIVGGGIIGTMHAVLAAEKGLEVIHLERDMKPQSASVRNFGLIWVSGRLAGEAPLLNKGIADRFTSAITELAKSSSLKTFAGKSTDGGFGVSPTVFIVDWTDAFKNKELLEEHFGPTTVIIRADFAKFQDVALKLEGQLTASLHATAGEDVSKLIEALSNLAGRVIMNGFPTAVAVTTAMQHGGQFPSSSSHTTSVGLDAIYRFMRPVAYQNFLDELLPPALQEANPLGINRVING
jgi:NADP-dependent aldehyde dehydrogenase